MRVIKALKTINYRMWIAILATMLLPTIYQTVKFFFLGDMPSDCGINIASQLQWVNLFYAIIPRSFDITLFLNLK